MQKHILKNLCQSIVPLTFNVCLVFLCYQCVDFVSCEVKGTSFRSRDSAYKSLLHSLLAVENQTCVSSYTCSGCPLEPTSSVTWHVAKPMCPQGR